MIGITWNERDNLNYSLTDSHRYRTFLNVILARLFTREEEEKTTTNVVYKHLLFFMVKI